MRLAGLIHIARAGISALLTKGADWLVRVARRVEPSNGAVAPPETGRPAPTDGVDQRSKN